MFDSEEARKNKYQRLTNLLALPNQPSRTSLFKDIQAKGLLKRARPEIRDLYNILEVDFHPLSICKKISPILSQIGSDLDMGKYVLPLQQVILTRLFQQLSQVYESVDLNFVLGLAQFPSPFEVSESTIEKFIMNGCKKGDLGIRIDHATGALTFDSDVFSSAKALHPGSGAASADAEAHSVQRLQSTPAEIVRSQLTRLAKTLFVTCQYVDASFDQEQRNARTTALERACIGMEKEHFDNLQRRDVIDKKKQVAASIAAQKKKEEENRSKLKAQELEQAEIRRIQEQNRERDSKRQQAIQERIQKAEIETQLKDLQQGKHKIDITNLNLDNLDTQAIRILKLQALEKEKQELSERLRIVGKRNDHLERAFRREEIKHMPEDYESQRQRDFAEYEKVKAETMQDAEMKHQESVALKRRLTRLVGQYEEFRNQVRTERRAQFEKQRKTAERELQQKKEARINEYRDRQIRERQEAEARERFKKEEEERIQRELQEKTLLEEEKRRKAAEDKIKRDAERRVLDEKAALQRQREAEIEAKLAAKKSGRAVPERPAAPPVMERSESSGPPRLPVKSVGGWREREAARLAGQTTSIASEPLGAVSSDETPSLVTKGSGYVLPHLRKNIPGKLNDNLGAATANESPGSWSRSRREEGITPRIASQGYGSARTTDRAASPGNIAGLGREHSGGGEVDFERAASPVAPQAAGGTSKYRPGAFRRNQQ